MELSLSCDISVLVFKFSVIEVKYGEVDLRGFWREVIMLFMRFSSTWKYSKWADSSYFLRHLAVFMTIDNM